MPFRENGQPKTYYEVLNNSEFKEKDEHYMPLRICDFQYVYFK